MNVKIPVSLPLLCAVLLLAITPETAFPVEKTAARGNKVQLSLRIAKARKAQAGIKYYKSVARQQNNRRTVTARPPSSAR